MRFRRGLVIGNRTSMLSRFSTHKRGTAAPARQELARAGRRIAAAQQQLATLRAENERLRTRFDLMLHATNDGMWDMEVSAASHTDPANPFWYTDQFRRLLGYTCAEDFPNLLSSWSSRLHPEDAAATLAAFHAHLADRSGATAYDVRYRLRCRTGEYRWFQAIGNTLRDADGRPLRVAGALTDITDRVALLDVKQYTETIIASLPAGLMILDDGLRVRSVNPAFQKIFGLRGAGSAASDECEVLLAQSGLRERAAAVMAEGGPRHGIDITLGARRLRVAAAGVALPGGERRLLVVAEDVTEEQRLRDEARVHAARYRDQASLLDKARDAIVVRAIDGRVQFWNKGAERLYGWRADEVLGEPIGEALYLDSEVLAAATAATLASGEWSGEMVQVRRNGGRLNVECHWTLMRDEGNQPVSILAINTDITERKASDEKIRTLALYDTLTGLPNRTQFAERLACALASAERKRHGLVILFIDLNRFKEINDTQGHGVGDQVLISVARRFQATLREQETLARLAGDEFVVVAETSDRNAGALIAERLQRALADPIATRGHTFSVGLSIGIASYPADGQTMDDLLRRADIAMYRAKAAGGGHMFYHPDMSVGLAESMELAKDLAHAMNSGKLELHFQPQVSLASGLPIGAEVLLRWNDPQRGWVSPARFIPIAESRGMIGVLGKWVLRAACAQLRAWRAAGLQFPGRLAINVAAQQLEQPDFAESIQAIVDEAGLTPACIELELTESGLMANVERAITLMATLKEAGFAISIDDFGTGYSSLAYLRRLPADKLKIDISFVRDMLTERHDHTIVTTILGMARNLGLQAIAEGVELPEQAEALRRLGCDEAQGYFFGRPVAADVFASMWLRAPAPHAPDALAAPAAWRGH
jgi:diguanylate cyclase (GGDEF)-like protein/PAS domain S-box-containing protein